MSCDRTGCCDAPRCQRIGAERGRRDALRNGVAPALEHAGLGRPAEPRRRDAGKVASIIIIDPSFTSEPQAAKGVAV